MAFSRRVAADESPSSSRRGRGERGIWQRRYWEHTIRSDRDNAAHMDYIHFNPVKHGLVTDIAAWEGEDDGAGAYGERWVITDR